MMGSSGWKGELRNHDIEYRRMPSSSGECGSSFRFKSGACVKSKMGDQVNALRAYHARRAAQRKATHDPKKNPWANAPRKPTLTSNFQRPGVDDPTKNHESAYIARLSSEQRAVEDTDEHSDASTVLPLGEGVPSVLRSKRDSPPKAPTASRRPVFPYLR